MAGLNNFLSDTQQTSTTMPAWYDQAQQNIVQQGGQAMANAPTLGQTTAQGAINTLQGPNNPFQQAQGTLQQISSGAANPWIVTPQYSQPQYQQPQNASSQPYIMGQQVNGIANNDASAAVQGAMGGNAINDEFPSIESINQENAAQEARRAANPNYNPMSGAMGGLGGGMQPMGMSSQGQPTGYNVAPNPYTAMGGLFSAQQNELNQLMPDYTAPAQANAIGSGNFGSLRGQTAVDKAKGDAFAKLNAAQMQAALTNQQTGYQAAAGLGNVGQQGINAAMNVGQTQMNAPFNNLANYSNLISSMPVPTTTQSQVQYSPLSQIQAVGNTATGGLAALYKTAAGKNILDRLGIGSWFTGANSGGGTASSGGTYDTGTDYSTVVPESTNPVIPVDDTSFDTNPV